MPKPMLEVAGTPLIDRIVAGIEAGGVRSVVVVTGYLASTVEQHLAATSPLPVAFIRQDEQDGTGGALRLVHEAVGREPFLLSWGDIATDSRHFDEVIAAWRPELAAVIGVNQVEDVSRGAAVVFTGARRITSIVEKPSGEPPSRWNNSGVMVFGPQIWGALEHIGPSGRGELELPDAISSLIAEGELLEALPLTGRWFDIGTASSLEAAREAFQS
jgi:glucose-1-phosphate thymidylyltransferase